MDNSKAAEDNPPSQDILATSEAPFRTPENSDIHQGIGGWAVTFAIPLSSRERPAELILLMPRLLVMILAFLVPHMRKRFLWWKNADGQSVCRAPWQPDPPTNPFHAPSVLPPYRMEGHTLGGDI
ncbi:hypothetical protein A6R68_05462, partial [Neotoma lepida]